MYVFLDESGDTGFKFEANSSPLFIITLLLVREPAFLNHLVESFKSDMGMSQRDELKFRTAKPRTRERFFSTIQAADFSIVSCIIDKRRLPSHRRIGSQAFYQVHVRDALTAASNDLVNARLVIDESVKSKLWQREIATYLRQHFNYGSERVLRDIRFKSSARDPLLQATDMICGAVAAYAVDGERRFLEMLEGRSIETIWIPGRNE